MKRLHAALRALHLLTGMLLSSALRAQGDEDPDYSRLIFEVAEIPPAVVDADAGAGNAGADSAVAGPAGSGESAASEASVTDDADASNINLSADIEAYRARINDTLATDNPYSTNLREQYDALGSLLQQAGEHEDAIGAFESAMHIDRVNGGLYTLEQIPVVEKMLASYEALGNAEKVNDLHGYLFYIKQKTYDDDDPRLLTAMEEWADWNVASYLKEGPRYSASSFNAGASMTTGPMDYVAVQNRDGTYSYVPRAHLMGALSPLRTSSLLDPTFLTTYGVDAERIIDERLRAAREYYEQIAEKAETNADADATGDAQRDEIRIQHKLANVAFAVKEQIDGVDTVASDPSFTLQPRTRPQAVTRGYIQNREALEAIAQELEQDPAASVVDKAQAWISLGDWHVAYDYGPRSTDAYRKAWELMNAAGMDESAIAEVLMPKPLIPAPAMAVHPFSREIYGIDADADIAWRGHIDLTLNVNRYGDVGGVTIDTVSPGTTQTVRRELLDYLRELKVRPAVVAGDTVKREDVKMRYYYSY